MVTAVEHDRDLNLVTYKSLFLNITISTSNRTLSPKFTKAVEIIRTLPPILSSSPSMPPISLLTETPCPFIDPSGSKVSFHLYFYSCCRCESKVIKVRLNSDMYVEADLVDMHAKCSLIDDGRKVFDRMSKRDLVYWTTMIMVYEQVERANDALILLDKRFEYVVIGL
ncbi:Pentatricopeptide repeat-containing protein [Camellia lanceoleosa]|uniref:Pentatricopeptide repeat-containing protein n=1 Tax=Camellia lanceoleosa TaxID=1840588 RepID=A0ACC0I9U6_9ERIC|nr:Pentatricopeptide repeat-containing protein [Camellia lanceoleosa]